MHVSFADLEYYLAASLLVFSLIAMGCTLAVRDFVVVVKSPLAIVLVMVVPLLVIPLLAVSLAKVLGTTPGVAIGMLLIAALQGWCVHEPVHLPGEGERGPFRCGHDGLHGRVRVDDAVRTQDFRHRTSAG